MYEIAQLGSRSSARVWLDKAVEFSKPLMKYLDQIPEPYLAWLSLGGPVAAVLLFLSVISLTIILIKLLQLIFGRFYGRNAVNKALTLWTAGHYDEAIESLRRGSAKTPKILRHSMRLLRRQGATYDLVREEVARIANRCVERQRSYLRALEVIGMVSPLLGLMGTVLGMINAFQKLEAGGSQVDPSVLSGGIWTALLTTGIGLAVAIPTVLAYHWLDQRFLARAQYLDDSLTRLFTARLYPGDRGRRDSSWDGGS